MSGSVWIRVVAVWSVSRAFFFAAGALGHALVPQGDIVGAYPEPIGSLGYWAHWDGRWFAHIAQHGYDTVPSTAFFPVFPLLVRLGTEAGLGIAVAGVAISTIASLAAFWFVHELAREWFDERAALAAILAPAALGPLLIYTSGLPLVSYPRYVLVVFPLFIALGATLARSRVALALWRVGSAALGTYLTLLFVSWRWVA